MLYERKSKRPLRVPSKVLRSFIAISEDHGDLHTVWQTCLRNDTPGLQCPDALYCCCERHASGATLMSEVRSYDSWDAAVACADVLNEPLLFRRDGSPQMEALSTFVPPVAVLPSNLGDEDVPF